MKKLVFSTVFFTLFAARLLIASDATRMQNLEQRISNLEKRKATKGIVNPPERPIVKSGFDLFVQGDALLWQASESNLGYAIKNTGSTTYLNDGKLVKPFFPWEWGFKLAVGSNMMHDGWDTFVEWTRFYTLNTEHGVSADPGKILFPTYVNAALATDGSTPGAIDSGFQGASAYWKLRLNILDLNLGREFYVSKWLTLRPFTSVRSGWFRQRYNVNYNNGTISPSLTGQDISVRMHNNFWGVGPRGGLSGQWLLGGGTSIFSDFAAAILLGHFKITQFETRSSAPPVDDRLQVKEQFRAARATIDMRAGLRYQGLYSHDRYGLLFVLAWEQHLFFNQNQLMKFPSPSGTTAGEHYPGQLITSDGDLSTEGVTFSLRFDF
jgi:hypothetical protein